MIWNIYFAIIAVLFGFFAATLVGIFMSSSNKLLSRISGAFVFTFRGSPLFIQFFLAYEILVILPKVGVDIPLGFITISLDTQWFTRAWLGAAIVLFLNTTAYSAQLFNGAYKALPPNEIMAADAYALHGWRRFRRITWPTLLRLAWPAYTNEIIFLFHSTTLVFFSAFPSRQQRGDGLYYAQYLAEKTYNPFISYPIIALYFIILTLLIIVICNQINRRLNRHLPPQIIKRPSFFGQLWR